jgi:hypothetical protein
MTTMTMTTADHTVKTTGTDDHHKEVDDDRRDEIDHQNVANKTTRTTNTMGHQLVQPPPPRLPAKTDVETYASRWTGQPSEATLERTPTCS